MPDRYLVTGAAGFIGSQVTRRLHDAGHTVVGIDNFNTSYDPRLKEWRLAQLTPLERFQFHRADLVDLPALEQIFNESAKTNPGSPPFAAVLNLGALRRRATFGGRSVGVPAHQCRRYAECA